MFGAQQLCWAFFVGFRDIISLVSLVVISQNGPPEFLMPQSQHYAELGLLLDQFLNYSPGDSLLQLIVTR